MEAAPSANESGDGDEPRDKATSSAASRREVRYEYTPNLPAILEHLKASLLVSTYQAGKLVVLGTQAGRLTVTVRDFERAMGVAAAAHAIAIGTRRQIHFLRPAHDLASRLEPAGTFDRCWVPRLSFYTGNVHGHDLAWGSDGLWVVNTLFSTLGTLHEDFNFVPRWRPRFITELIDQDRCHLNGVALADGKPKIVTAMAESNEPSGWRPTKASTGCVIDVPSQETVARGFAMPHSPRLYQDRLWVLDSGRGRMSLVEPASGRIEPIVEVPGYTRGLAFAGQFAFVGLSRIRETSVFGGVPIAERRDQLKCGIAVVDLVSGRAVAAFRFENGVEEIFAVEVLPRTRNPALFGPSLDEDEQREIWIVPSPGHSVAPEDRPALWNRGADGDTVRQPETARPAATTIDTRSFARGDLRTTQSGDVAPADSQVWAARGDALHRQGRLHEAAAALRKAADSAADPAPLLTNLGNVQQELGDQDRALACYRQAVEKNAACVPAHQNLGYLLANFGEPDQALEHYRQALRVNDSPMNRLLAACVLPVVYDSTDDVQRWRRHLEESLRALAAEQLTVDAARQMVPTSFFVAYQGLNDREVMRWLGQVCRGAEDVAAAGDGTGRLRIAGRKLRIGFLSAYFRDHTIGRLNLGRVQRLSRDRLEICVLYAARQADGVTDQFRQSADQFLVLPRDVVSARKAIVEAKLDVLIFADVGMDALTSTLAWSRLAPVQCATWGHPDTTGSPQIDYFLSSELLEIESADAHYTERLVRLPNLATYFERPRRVGPPRSRAFFGLPEQRHLYVCPQTLFKFHPEFDHSLAGILAADPAAELVLLEGRVSNWTRRLRSRLERTLPDGCRRVRFLPAQPRDDFLALLELADVVLDPPHFGGGHTSYEALAVGTPVVTLPGEFLRSRITQALYRRMGDTDAVVDSPAEFIRVAVQLATQPAARRALSERLRQANHVLFDNPDDVRALEEFLLATSYTPRGRN